jgi:hypothetical protein
MQSNCEFRIKAYFYCIICELEIEHKRMHLMNFRTYFATLHAESNVKLTVEYLFVYSLEFLFKRKNGDDRDKATAL